LTGVSAAGLSSELSAATVQQALTASETQTLNQAKAKGAYDYIVIGSGASGSIIAGELSKTGADVLVVESGGEDAEVRSCADHVRFRMHCGFLHRPQRRCQPASSAKPRRGPGRAPFTSPASCSGA
jgi:hypothetical protein